MTISEKQAKRRKEIAMAVREFMKDSDFDSITVDDICNATGIAKGTFYHYFEGKESLLNQFIHPIDDYFSSLDEELKKCESFLEAINQFAVYYATYIIESGLKISRTVLLAMISPQNTNYVSDNRGMINVLSGIIEYWQNKGEVTNEYTVQKMCHMFLVVFRGYLLNWYSSGGNYDLEKEIADHVSLMASSLLKK